MVVRVPNSTVNVITHPCVRAGSLTRWGMIRSERERLSRDELIDLVLRLQRPETTSRTSSKPPSSDRKERREKARPGGAKPGHQGHSRVLVETPSRVVDH